MFSFFLKPKTAFGLDISETALRLMQLKPFGSRFYPSAFADIPLPKGLVADDSVSDAAKFAHLLSKGLQKPDFGAFDSRYAVLSLPESKSFVRVISVPKMSEEEAKEAVPFEAEQYIPLTADQVFLDFRPVPPQAADAGKMKVVICATPKTLVENYVEAVKLANVKPVAAELESEATSRALIGGEQRNGPTLIIDSSASRTNLIIFDAGALQFSSSLPLGGNSLTAQLAQHLTVSFEEAEKLKRQLGLSPGRGGAASISAALQPLLRSLLEAVANTLNFYREHSEGGREISEIVLSGGASKIKGLSEYLSQQLPSAAAGKKMNIHTGDPWVNVLERPMKKIPPISKLDSISFTTVIGLALRGMDME